MCFRAHLTDGLGSGKVQAVHISRTKENDWMGIAQRRLKQTKIPHTDRRTTSKGNKEHPARIW